jgi:hypothetical protein
VSAFVVDLHDYDIFVLVLGDGGPDDRRGNVVLSGAESGLVAVVFFGGERSEGRVGVCLSGV